MTTATISDPSHFFHHYVKPYVSVENILVYILTAGATIAGGLLSYAGAIALGFTFAPALVAFGLTAIISLAVNYKMINRGLIKRLFNINKSEHLPTDLLFLLVSALAAISFSASTLFSAAALFGVGLSATITVVTSIAYFFITYEILHKAKSFFTLLNLHNKTDGFIGQQPNKNSFFNKKLLLCGLVITVLAICFYSVFLTIPTWQTETLLGLNLVLPIKLSAPIALVTSACQILSNTLFIMINSLKAVFKLGSININTGQLLPEITNPSQKYNPFFWAIVGIDLSASLVIFTAHCVCHALMFGSRNFSATTANTISDGLPDASMTIIPSKHSHTHEPFDSIMVATKALLTLPLQIFAIPCSIMINKIHQDGKYYQQPWKKIFSVDCLKDTLADNFYFVVNHIKLHQHSHDDHQHQADSHNDAKNNHQQNSHSADTNTSKEQQARKPGMYHRYSHYDSRSKQPSPTQYTASQILARTSVRSYL